jgi:hypothetical protein
MKKKKARDLRDYGLGSPHKDGKVTNPRVVEKIKDMPPCPNCGCKDLYMIAVDIENKLLRGGKGVGRYVGCPACPFASPMMIMATPDPSPESKSL